MNISDGRSLSHEAREEIRIRAVERVEAGESPEDVIKALGFHRSCIYDWLAKYREGGLEALRYKKIPGKEPKLSGKQLDRLYKLITSKNPLQLNFEFALWTRGMIRQLIWDEFNVRLSEVSVGRLLKKLGFSPQKPLRRAYEQDSEQVSEWRQKTYPKIQRRAKKLGASIYFADEAAVRSDCHRGRTWAPKGNTPIVETTGARYSINLISAVSAKGQMKFMTIPGKFNSERFIDFLERLLVNQKKPVFVIVDGHRAHKSASVKEFVKNQNGRLELYYLPPYSPELNPDEHVWKDLKSGKIGRKTIKNKEDFKEKVSSALRSLQRMPKKIRGFFQAPTTVYAANNVG